MTHFGNILIRARIPAGDVADVAWRNADLTDVDFTAVVPSEDLVDELLIVAAGGSVGEHVSRLVPDAARLAALVGHASATVRRGAVANRLTTTQQLQVLAGDADGSVAEAAADELTVRGDLRSRCTAGELDAACEVLRRGRVEEIGHLLEVSPRSAAAAVASEDAAVEQLQSLAPGLFSNIAVTVLGDDECLVPFAVASWSCNDDAASTALQGAMTSPNRLRRRCTPAAFRTLVAAGILPSPAAQQPRPSHTRLDDMLLVLEPLELAGLFFSSQDVVSDEVAELVFEHAPVSLLVNFLLGQTPRRPKVGEVTSMLRSFSGDRRAELSVALEEAVVKAEQADADSSPLMGFPWSGELLLCLQRTRALNLSPSSATDLYVTIDGILAADGPAWEYLFALEGEWESALFDLVLSAAHMEGLPVESSL